MNHYLIRPQENSEFYTEEQCYILELLHNNSNAPFSIARAKVLPGITTRWHKLRKTDEYYLIIDGSGRMEIGDYPPFEVTKGDIITIPRDVNQRITNISLVEELIFYAVCSPAFKQENYIDTDKM